MRRSHATATGHDLHDRPLPQLHNSTGTGSKFLPIHHPKNDFERFIDDTLRIQWCPNEKHFVVMIEGVPYQLISA